MEKPIKKKGFCKTSNVLQKAQKAQCVRINSRWDTSPSLGTSNGR